MAANRTRLHRRHFIRTGMAGLMASAAGAAPAVALDAERRKAVRRPRRVIFNNDGNDAFATDAPATREGFLSVRMDHFPGCGVDSVFYCTAMSSGAACHDILHFSARVLVSLAGQFRQSGHGRLTRSQPEP